MDSENNNTQDLDVQKLLEENERLKEQLIKENEKLREQLEQKDETSDNNEHIESKNDDVKEEIHEDKIEVLEENTSNNYDMETLMAKKKKPKKNNKKLIVIIISVVVLLLVAALVTTIIIINNNNKFSINKFKKNIVLIQAYDDDGNLFSTGSGVYVDNTTIFTNAHVVKDAKSLEIVLDNNMKVKLKGIQSYKEKKDIAILKTEKVESVKPLRFAKSAKAGTEVYAVGSPLGIKNAVSDGVISGSYKDSELNMKVYQHTAPISPGSSGGALVNKRGELIGINYATYTDGQNLNLAIKINDFYKEYEKTKNDKLIEIETSDFFDIKELSNTPGKEIMKEVCSINTDCDAFITKDNYYEETDYYKGMQKDVVRVIRIESLRDYDQKYDGDDWLRIYLFHMKKEKKDNDELFKKLVEYKALETRDYYYLVDFNHYWAKNKEYYYYIEYGDGIDISKIVKNLSDLTGGTYE